MNEWMNEKRCEIRLAPASWSVDGRFLFFFVVVVCYQHHFQSLAFHRAQKWNSDRGTLMANSRIVFSPKKQDGADTIRRPLRMSPVENENAELKREKNERKMNAGTAWGRLFWASRGHGPVTSIFVIVAGVVSAPSRRGLVGVKFPRETKLNGNVSDSTRQNPKFQAHPYRSWQRNSEPIDCQQVVNCCCCCCCFLAKQSHSVPFIDTTTIHELVTLNTVSTSTRDTSPWNIYRSIQSGTESIDRRNARNEKSGHEKRARLKQLIFTWPEFECGDPVFRMSGEIVQKEKYVDTHARKKTHFDGVGLGWGRAAKPQPSIECGQTKKGQ